MRLTQKAQVTLNGACVASLIFAGTGYAQAKSVEAKYEEQSKQIELYKDELNDMQGQLQEYTKYKAMYECMAVEKDQLQKQVDELNKEILMKQKELDDVKKQLTQSSKKYSSFIEETIIYIKEHIADDLSLELIAQNVHTNESYLSRTFKKECGHSIVSYITMLRISMAKDFLANTNLKTFEISDKIGIHDPAYFSVIFKKNTGLSPKDYRNQFVR